MHFIMRIHVIMRMHAIQTIHHIDRGEDKKQVQLELNMYFCKLICRITNIHLKIAMDTMHQCVFSSVAPKETIHM